MIVNLPSMNSKIKVLIAGDDLEDQEMLMEGLAESISHFEVELASDGLELLRLMRGGCNPDIIFLDLDLPIKSGIECLEEMNNEEMMKDTPVVLYSTSQRLKDIQSAAGLGARFYMVKPGCIRVCKQLIKAMLQLLGLPRYEQQKKQNFVIAQEKLAKVLNYHLSM
jgi:CheY-like chemotaxis protein